MRTKNLNYLYSSRFFITCLALVLAAAPFFNRGPQAAKDQDKTAWKVDLKNSRVQFVSYARLGDVEGKFRRWWFRGSIPADLKNTKGVLVVDVKSLYTANSMRDNHLRNEDFFDVGKYPYAIFRIKALEVEGKSIKAIGELEIKKIKKQMTVNLKRQDIGDKKIVLGTTLKLNRRSFKINYSSMLNPIEDRVDLKIKLTLVKQ